MKNLSKVGLALAAVLLLMSPGAARADILMTLASMTSVGSDIMYTYDVTLTTGSVLQAAGGGANAYAGQPSNNFFTLYDIQGLVAGSVTYGGILGAAGNSTFTQQNSGLTPAGQSPIPPDNSSIANISTFWTGAPITASSAAVDLGTFSFLDTNPLGADMLAYAGATQKLELLAEGGIANNIAQVMGPGPSGPPPTVPEPATLALLAIGLPVLGGYCYRRRNA